jgi:hypothetical protein
MHFPPARSRQLPARRSRLAAPLAAVVAVLMTVAMLVAVVARTAPSSASPAFTVAAPAAKIVTKAAGSAKAPNPGANIPESTGYPSSCLSQPTAQPCQDSAIAALNHARAVMGLGPYDLPPGFSSLDQPTQLVVLSNLDRSAYGLPPILGTTLPLNQAANTGITGDTDPTGLLGSVGGLFYSMWTANWAAGWASALYTYYEWMYNDGLGSSNIDCTAGDTGGCWGHRQNTLANFPTSTIVMGVATGTSPAYQAPAFTEVYESVAIGTPTYLPLITGIAQQQASSNVQITGLGFLGATNVSFAGLSTPFVVNSYNSISAAPLTGLPVSVAVTTPGGTSPPVQSPTLVSAAPALAGSYLAVTPFRVLDTRQSTPIAASDDITVPIAGHGAVPLTGVSAVVLNVTAVSPQSTGFLTVFPTGTARPTTSNVNFRPAVTVPNLVVMPLGANGSVDIYSNAATPQQVIVDVFGYFVDGVNLTAGAFGSVSPTRVLDSRNGTGMAGGARARVAGGSTISVPVAGIGGVPPVGVSAVVINVTAASPASVGYLTVWASGTARPFTSNVNYAAGIDVANLVVAPVGADGRINIYNSSSGSVDVIGDVSGYYVGGLVAAGGALSPLAPARVLDTRIATGAPQLPVAPGATVRLQVTGRAGVPSANVCAVALNVTAVSPSAAIFVTVWADGTPRPTTSNLNVNAGQVVPNLVVAPVGALGQVDFYVSPASSTHLVADVMGYISCSS